MTEEQLKEYERKVREELAGAKIALATCEHELTAAQAKVTAGTQIYTELREKIAELENKLALERGMSRHEHLPEPAPIYSFSDLDWMEEGDALP